MIVTYYNYTHAHKILNILTDLVQSHLLELFLLSIV